MMGWETLYIRRLDSASELPLFGRLSVSPFTALAPHSLDRCRRRTKQRATLENSEFDDDDGDKFGDVTRNVGRMLYWR